ncbi:MAG TPA: glycosyltransferase [Steroidobacteraceae bacterium]|nr:glycosyltransferase [Steroidobacteraceae bacterium]
MNDACQPAVSVVMATFNRPEYLRAAIESVLTQTGVELELIIADDGSDAPTRELLRAFERPPLRVLWLAHCGNPGAVRNAAVRAARGQYIAFIDSDDVWLPSKLERQLASLHRQADCRWSYTACVHIDAQGNRVSPKGVQPWQPHSGPMLEAVAGLRAHSALPTVLVERDLLLEAGLFDERLAFFEDHDLWLRLALRSEADVVTQPLVQVRRHDHHYSGHNELTTAECRAVFLDRAWRSVTSVPLRAQLRRTRALNASRLARLRAATGATTAARSTLRSSLADGWRYSRWWIDAAICLFASLVKRTDKSAPAAADVGG